MGGSGAEDCVPGGSGGGHGSSGGGGSVDDGSSFRYASGTGNRSGNPSGSCGCGSSCGAYYGGCGSVRGSDYVASDVSDEPVYRSLLQPPDLMAVAALIVLLSRRPNSPTLHLGMPTLTGRLHRLLGCIKVTIATTCVTALGDLASLCLN